MKKCFSTLACAGASLDEVLAAARKADITALEVRLDKDNRICGFGVADSDIVRSKLDMSGCVITDLASSVSVKDRNKNALFTARSCIDLASEVGARAVRIFVGAHIKTFDEIPMQNLEGAAVTVAEMCAYAKPLGIEIWAETHSSLSTAKAMCEFCDMVDADNLKVLWDVLHSLEFGEPPEVSLSIIGTRLAHVHLKDAVPTDDPKLTQYRHTALGAGTFPLEKVLTLLAEAGYNGYVSLEYELPWRAELKGCYADTDTILAAYNRWLASAKRE